jgi:hypothetical protein
MTVLRSSTSSSSILFLFLLSSLSIIFVVDASGVQSDKSAGAFHTGGMVYDPNANMLYMTGLHYNSDLDDDIGGMSGSTKSDKSNCFVASIDLASEKGLTKFEDWESYGSPSAIETCSTLVLHKNRDLVVIGNSEPGGFVSGVDSSIPLSGMIAIIERNMLSFVTGQPLTSPSSPQTKILYPIDAVSDGADSIYVVALSSIDANKNTELGRTPNFPNWEEVQLYGSSFDMMIIKISMTQEQYQGIPSGNLVVETVWTKEFPMEFDGSGHVPRVYIGGIIYKKDLADREMLIVAGSTRGQGNIYGDAEGDDEDGFLAIIDPLTGEEFGKDLIHSKREGSPEDDIVTAVCDDPNDPSSFYIVGATIGVVGNQ